VCQHQQHVLLSKCGVKVAAAQADVVAELAAMAAKVEHMAGLHAQPVLPIKFCVHVLAYVYV
jgi:hypothetical protein